MVIDKEKFKEYVNIKRAEDIHMIHIERIELFITRYGKHAISPDSMYRDIVERDGYVELIMIKPTWNGWRVAKEQFYKNRPELIGTWMYGENLYSNRFNLEIYMNWLVEQRNKDIDLLLR